MAFYDSSGMKVGRNSPCPCGSGKKFKCCCIHKKKTEKKKELDRIYVQPSVQRKVQQKVEEIQHQERAFEAKHGKTRPIITSEFKDWRVVCVGNEVHFGKKDKTKFFPDFLTNYIRSKLGKDWGNSEIAKPYEERHQVLKWYDSMCHYQMRQKPKPDGTYSTFANGSMMSWYRLAYDLYLIKHNAKLQEEILKRIKIKDQFQGARFELYATASMIVAGFKIEFEDETDRTRKHPEFIAIHPSGQQIAVEAKSRHRNGVLEFNSQSVGKDEDQSPKVSVERLLRRALSKNPDYPYFIFVDVNLPYSQKDILGNPWFKEMAETVEKLKSEWSPEPFPVNAIYFCNDPTYQEPEKIVDGNSLWIFEVPIENPKYPLYDPMFIRNVTIAAQRRANIPNKFPEEVSRVLTIDE